MGNGTSPEGGAIGIAMMAILAIGYFLPALIAQARGRESWGLLALANLLFGWTVLGWFVLLIVAFTGENKMQRQHRLATALPPPAPVVHGSTCSACGAHYPQVKSTCPNCGAAIAAPAQIQPRVDAVAAGRAAAQGNTNRNLIIAAGAAVGLVVLLLFVGAIGGMLMKTGDGVRQTASTPTSPSAVLPKDAAPTQSTGVVQSTPEQTTTPRGDWQYHEYTDDLTGKPYRVATLDSDNTFEFGFPYAGAQHAQLVLRNDPRSGRDAMLRIERGQILCHSFSDCSIEIAIDANDPRTVQGTEPADNSTTTVFLPQPKRLTDQIAKGKQVRIRFNVFQQGAVTAMFNVEGFDPKQLEL